MRILSDIAIILVLAIAGAALFIWSGLYNMAATEPHWDITHTVLEQVRERSIESHSRGINVPSLSDPAFVRTGFQEFHATCRLCHGAPGHNRSGFAMGLYPSPPDLASGHVQKEVDDAAIFWVIKNGLKMTGMPAFGVVDDDEELWATVAFLKILPGIGQEGYARMLAEAGSHQE